jgi:hypothetical protein
MQTLQELIGARDVAGIKAFMAEHNMVLREGKIVPADDGSRKKLKAVSGFWNQRQQARKILLNSLYGALLNEGLRFYDERVGQSVTLTGRSIVRHMNAKVNEVLCGLYDYTGRAIVYADTDSCYFNAMHLKDADMAEWRETLFSALHQREVAILADETAKGVEPAKRISIVYDAFDFDKREHMIRLYDDVADATNDSFPEFMHRTFNTTMKRGAIIAAGRELVASAGLFIKKKKYGLLKYEEEGFRLDVDGKPGKLKAMGLDLKRADTPKFMQKFLEKTLLDLLTGAKKDDILDSIRQFREDFKERPAWEKGSPKKVNGLSVKATALSRAASASVYTASAGKINLPGHVKASLNWNTLCDVENDRYAMRITDGGRIIVCKLLPNPMRMDSVAYPMDEPHIPPWFKALPFDEPAMEETIIDNKLDNLLGVLNWDLSVTKAGLDDDMFS